MNTASALRELVTLAGRPQGVVWPQLQPHHRQQIQTATRSRLIVDTVSGYRITPEGQRFIAPAAPEPVPGKVCPACHEDKPADQFWADPNRSDSLFYYCISCESARRKEVRRVKREHIANIKAAAQQAQQAAKDWDTATELLTRAWANMVAADTAVRQARAAGVTQCDWGTLDLRLMHQAGAYTLAKAMTTARYPWPGSFLHNDAMATSMVAWIGDNPAEPYLGAGKESEENEYEVREGQAATAECGQAEGYAEQGNDRIPGDHPETAGVELGEREPVAQAGRRGRPRKGTGLGVQAG